MKINYKRTTEQLESVGVNVQELRNTLLKDSVENREGMDISFKLDLTKVTFEDGEFVLSGSSRGSIEIKTQDGNVSIPWIHNGDDLFVTWEI